jgi:hypothetical protein
MLCLGKSRLGKDCRGWRCHVAELWPTEQQLHGLLWGFGQVGRVQKEREAPAAHIATRFDFYGKAQQGPRALSATL